MDEGPGFIAAILAASSDDVPRLIYADWLDERGESDRADLIRVQCELAPLRYDDDRISDLQAREYRLLSRHFAAWRRPHHDVRFHRGFIEELQFWRPETYLAGEGIRLLTDCPHMMGLRWLDLSWIDLDQAEIEQMARCPYLAGLTSLRIGSAGMTDDGCTALADSPYLSRLVYLNLESSRVAEPGVAAFARSPNASRLRVWVLPCMVSNGSLRALAESPHLGRLTTLIFQGSAASDEWPAPTDAGASALAGSANLANLAVLDCNWPNISGPGLRQLLESERLAWHGTSDLQHSSAALQQAYEDRFGGFSPFDLFGVGPEPLFPWASWA